MFEASWCKKIYGLTYIDLRLTSLLFFDHSTRGQRRWDVIFLTFSLKSRKTISFKHSSTLSTSINYGLCAFFDILNTMASQIHGEIIDSIALQPYKAHYILGNLKDISQNVHEKISSFDLYRHCMITITVCVSFTNIFLKMQVSCKQLSNSFSFTSPRESMQKLLWIPTTCFYAHNWNNTGWYAVIL